MVIERHIKVLRGWNAQGEPSVPIRIATKGILCQSLQLGLCCYFPFRHPLFHPWSLALCHVWCSAGGELNVHVTSEDEATLCQVVVAHSAHPATSYASLPTRPLVSWCQKVFLDESRTPVNFFSLFRLNTWEMFSNPTALNCSSEKRKKKSPRRILMILLLHYP